MGSLRGSIEASVRKGDFPPPLCSPGEPPRDALTDSLRPDALRAQLPIGHVRVKENENRTAAKERKENEEKGEGGFGFHFEQDTRRREVQALALTSGSYRTPDFTYEALRDQVRKRNMYMRRYHNSACMQRL